MNEKGWKNQRFVHHRVANSRDSSMQRPVSWRSRCRSVLPQNLGVLSPFVGKMVGKPLWVWGPHPKIKPIYTLNSGYLLGIYPLLEVPAEGSTFQLMPIWVFGICDRVIYCAPSKEPESISHQTGKPETHIDANVHSKWGYVGSTPHLSLQWQMKI